MSEQTFSGRSAGEDDFSIVEAFRVWWRYRVLVVSSTLILTSAATLLVLWYPGSFTAHITVRILDQPTDISSIPALDKDVYYEVARDTLVNHVEVSRHPGSAGQIRARSTDASRKAAVRTLEEWCCTYKPNIRNRLRDHLTLGIRSQILTDTTALAEIKASLAALEDEKPSPGLQSLILEQRSAIAETRYRLEFYADVLEALENGIKPEHTDTLRVPEEKRSAATYAHSLFDLYDASRIDPIQVNESRPSMGKVTLTTLVLSLTGASLAAFLIDSIRQQAAVLPHP